MSQQVYANQADKYSPQSATNILQLTANVVDSTGADFTTLPAVIPSNGAFFNKLNGTTITRDPTGKALYDAQLIGGQTVGIVPVSTTAATPQPSFAKNGETYFRVLQAGTYTLDFHAAFGAPSAESRMWEIGWLISNQQAPVSGIDQQLYSPSVFWSYTGTLGNFALSSTLTKYLKPGQLIKPVILTTNGYTMFADMTDKAQTTQISWFKH